MKKIMCTVFFLTGLLLFTQTLFINEFMADNDNVIEDPDEPGAFDDWIELYNPNVYAIELSEMYLTDDLTDLTKWQIPDGVVISGGSFLLFWADNDEEQGDVHTNFKLSSGGEEIGLIDTDGSTIIDSYTFGPQEMDISEGRYPDGADNWIFMSAPTPGYSNGQSNNPPNISDFAQFPLLPSSGQDVNVVATVTDDNFVSTVYTKYDTGSGFIDLIMWDDGDHGDLDEEDGIYGCYIPSQASGTEVQYYIEATDNEGESTVYPVTSPDIIMHYIVDYEIPLLYLNEFMADNDSTITDPQGDFDDWIEIYNASTEPIDIGGMYLTDKFQEPEDWWMIPTTQPDSTTIAPGSFLLLWADSDIEFGVLHLDFKLSIDGEQIGLFAFYGTTPIDTLSFGVQTIDVSYGRYPDGSENWIFMNTPTPGSANSSALADDQIIDNTETISLLGNYPNPFNYETVIHFSLTRPEFINLNIYNVKGEKVRNLIHRELQPDTYSINWNGRDQNMKKNSSGIYIIKLSASTKTKVQKIILMNK